MKSGDGNAHILSVGAGIFKEVIIYKTSISPFQVLAQHVLAQFTLSQVVILTHSAKLRARSIEGSVPK